jgi:diguanylate cyclase (GGDEF)-like protein
VEEGVPIRRPRRRPTTAALATLLIGLVITGGAAYLIRDAAHHDAESQFQVSANQTALALEREVGRYFEELNSIGAFVASSPNATPGDFRRFVTEASTFKRLPSMEGVFYIERVEDQDMPAFIAREGERSAAFRYQEIGKMTPLEAHYVLIEYVPNAVDLKLPLGTDVTPISSLTKLMNESGARGKGITSSFQQDPLLQTIAKNTDFPLIKALMGLDFFIGEPVYATAPLDGIPSGQPKGWIGAPIARFEQVVNAARAGQPNDIGVRVTVDLDDAGMGQRADLSRVTELDGKAGPQGDAAFTTSRVYTVEGVTYRFDSWSTADAGDMPASVPIVLLVGTFMSLLAAGIVGQRRRTREGELAFATELADRASFQRDIVDSVTNPMVVLDAHGRVTTSNEAWGWLRDRSGSNEAEDASDNGRLYLDVLASDIRGGGEKLEEGIDQVLSGGAEAVEVDIPIDQHGRRRWYTVRTTPLLGGRGGAVVIHTDITERKRSHDELELKASRDPLTGLLNRSAIEDEIDTALVHARASGSMVAALFIDLDGFKAINDTHGHALGDDVLRSVAGTVSAAVRTVDSVGRIGGDEFVVLIESIDSVDVAARTAERILALLAEPVRFGEQTIQLGASIGVAVVDSPLQGSAENLLERADEAMYQAKQAGGSHFRLAL